MGEGGEVREKGDDRATPLSMGTTEEVSMSLVTVATRGLPALAFLLGSGTLAAQGLEPSAFAAAVDTRDAPIRPAKTDSIVQKELQLGGDYLLGRGVARNAELSAYWYRKAADQGDPGAENELGYFYNMGFGVPLDPQQAMRWYERAMGAGSEAAKLNLAVMYMKGAGTKRDVNLALELLQELAKKDNATAENYLGIIYFSGYGVPVDRVVAEKWFEQAVKHHTPEAEFSMATLYSVVDDHPHDLPKAAEWLRSSANGGYVLSMHALGLLLINHPELPHRPGEAVEMLQAAAAGGSWRSSITLGIVAGHGTSGSSNIADAYRWFTIAIRQGGVRAEKIVAGMMAQDEKLLDAAAVNRERQQADAWMAEHPHMDLFVLGDRYRSGPFPAAEIPLLGLAEVN